jgi:hypothetical protein
VTLFPVLYLAFKRNYPDVTEEQFADMLDLRSYSEVTSAVMAESGVKPAAPGEVTSPVTRLTGPGSTGRWSPLPGGLSNTSMRWA